MEKSPHQQFIDTLPLKDCRQIYKDYLAMANMANMTTADNTVMRQRADEYSQLTQRGPSADPRTMQIFAMKVFQRFAGAVLGVSSICDEDSGRYPYTLACDAIRTAGLAKDRSDASNVISCMAEARKIDDAELARQIADVELMHHALTDGAENLRFDQSEHLREEFSKLLPQPPK